MGEEFPSHIKATEKLQEIDFCQECLRKTQTFPKHWQECPEIFEKNANISKTPDRLETGFTWKVLQNTRHHIQLRYVSISGKLLEVLLATSLIGRHRAKIRNHALSTEDSSKIAKLFIIQMYNYRWRNQSMFNFMNCISPLWDREGI